MKSLPFFTDQRVYLGHFYFICPTFLQKLQAKSLSYYRVSTLIEKKFMQYPQLSSFSYTKKDLVDPVKLD